MGYVQALRGAMSMVAARPNSIILGQTVLAGGSGMSKTFNHIPKEKRLELPVIESTQLGMSIGLSLAGHFPIVSVYPRINFLLEAVGMLVSDLDKIQDFSDYCPRVIIRTAIARDTPMDPGPQHLGDYSHALHYMLNNVTIYTLGTPKSVAWAYDKALTAKGSSIIIEDMGLYDE